MKYLVKIGNRETVVLASENRKMSKDFCDPYDGFYGQDSLAKEFYGGHHNFDGLTGYVIAKAVYKLFGRGAYWMGCCDMIDCGQVVKRETRLTPRVIVSVFELKSGRRIV